MGGNASIPIQPGCPLINFLTTVWPSLQRVREDTKEKLRLAWEKSGSEEGICWSFSEGHPAADLYPILVC